MSVFVGPNGHNPKRGYQVGIRQLVRRSSITCIPARRRSWYHQDGDLHSLCVYVCVCVCEFTQKNADMLVLWSGKLINGVHVY